MDPEFIALMDSVKSRLRPLFGTDNEMTLPLSATGSAGMEACFANLLEAGDKIVIGVAGVFGLRMCEVASRIGAQVTRVETNPGTVLLPERMEEAINETNPHAVAFVHAETSTGALQPVIEIAKAAKKAGSLVILDCVTSLGGLPLKIDDWGIDAAYSGTQKCLSCPPGLSPISFSKEAVVKATERKSKVQSWYLDIGLLAGYYGTGQRVYHHTAPITAIYGLDEGLRQIEKEGLQARITRHADAAKILIEGLQTLGFEPLVEEEHRLPMLTSVKLPERVLKRGEGKVRSALLNDHGIEVGAGLGSLAGKIWRIGLMGENAREASVNRLLSALQKELAKNS
tara:strand:+ start:3910 stop:4932 length:1023 start_codon:yes stop_codon:yes gene_type:complete